MAGSVVNMHDTFLNLIKMNISIQDAVRMTSYSASKYLNQDEILIHVSLQLGTEQFTAYGCDLTDGYVRINADYTT
mgnify:CR=1 FL=1